MSKCRKQNNKWYIDDKPGDYVAIETELEKKVLVTHLGKPQNDQAESVEVTKHSHLHFANSISHIWYHRSSSTAQMHQWSEQTTKQKERRNRKTL